MVVGRLKTRLLDAPKSLTARASDKQQLLLILATHSEAHSARRVDCCSKRAHCAKMGLPDGSSVGIHACRRTLVGGNQSTSAMGRELQFGHFKSSHLD